MRHAKLQDHLKTVGITGFAHNYKPVIHKLI